jgi:hypothetical protein
MHPSRGQRGQAILLVMLSLIPICLAAGLVADAGMAYYTKTSERTAAQTAALGAVQAVMDGIYAGTYQCYSSGVCSQAPPVQSPTSCPGTGNLQNGCLYASTNGFANVTGGSQSVLIDAGTGSPPGVNVVANYWVRVQILQKNWLTFGATGGMQSLNVGATAIAAAVNMMPLNCVVALSSNADAALNLVGNVTLTTTDCGVAVDSNSATALSANGSTILSASSISVVGGASIGTTTVNPTPTTGIVSFPDPLEGVPAPTVPPGCTHPAPTTSNGVTTYSPGNYCTTLSFNNGSINFSPGTYFFIDGGLNVGGNTTITGSDVTFYLTSSSATCSACVIDMAGTGAVTLSAPTTGPLQGMLFFEDRNVTGGASSIVGNSGLNLSGTAYFPKESFTFSGNVSSQQMMLVANTVSMNGNVTLSINPESATAPLTAQIGAALIQ